jgi:hypothetical protein
MPARRAPIDLIGYPTPETLIIMNALAPYIAALHQQDLLEEAEIRRRVRLLVGSEPVVPAWRRRLGSGARGLSGLFASAARSIDPSVEDSSRSASGARAMAS